MVFRHGPAEVRDPARWPRDDRRPLSEEGRVETRRAAQGLVRHLDGVGLLATSGALRARQTAELLREALEEPPPIEVWEELSLGRLAGPLLDRVGRLPRSRRTVALIGHEPALSEFVGLALTGEGVPVVHLSKAGAVLIEFPSSVRPGAGRLLWALTRKQLIASRT